MACLFGSYEKDLVLTTTKWVNIDVLSKVWSAGSIKALVSGEIINK